MSNNRDFGIFNRLMAGCIDLFLLRADETSLGGLEGELHLHPEHPVAYKATYASIAADDLTMFGDAALVVFRDEVWRMETWTPRRRLRGDAPLDVALWAPLTSKPDSALKRDAAAFLAARGVVIGGVS